MQLQIFSKDFDLTPAIEQQISDRLQKVLQHLKYEPRFKVYLSKPTKHQYEVKFETHYDHKDFFADAVGEEFYQTLTLAKKTLLSQLDRHHAKNLR